DLDAGVAEDAVVPVQEYVELALQAALGFLERLLLGEYLLDLLGEAEPRGERLHRYVLAGHAVVIVAVYQATLHGVGAPDGDGLPGHLDGGVGGYLLVEGLSLRPLL